MRDYRFVCRVCASTFKKMRLRGSVDTCAKCLGRSRYRRFIALNPGVDRTYERMVDKDKKRANAKKHREAVGGRERDCEKVRRHYHKDIDASRARARARYAGDRDAHIQRVVRRSSRLRRATPQWANQSAIDEVYKAARRLTMETGVSHQVDHVIPLHGQTVCGLHVESNLRVVPADVNRMKSNRFSAALTAPNA